MEDVDQHMMERVVQSPLTPRLTARLLFAFTFIHFIPDFCPSLNTSHVKNIV